MMELIELNLESNYDILLSLAQFSKNNNLSAYVVSIVGDLSNVVFKCPINKTKKSIRDHLEIITLQGKITPISAHLHISVSNSECKVFGGHLEEGTIVLKSAMLLLTTSGKISSSYSGKTNTSTLDKTRIELFILPNCRWCQKVYELLNSKNINFTTTIITTDQEYKRIYRRTKSSIFPQLLIDNEFIGGYDSFMKYYHSGMIDEL